MVLEPGISEDHALLSETRDSEECPLRVSFVIEDYIYHFGDLTCLIRKTIYIIHWYGAGNAPGTNTFHMDKVFIYEVTHSSRVQKCLDGVHLAGVSGADFYREDDRHSVGIEGVDGESFG